MPLVGIFFSACVFRELTYIVAPVFLSPHWSFRVAIVPCFFFGCHSFLVFVITFCFEVWKVTHCIESVIQCWFSYLYHILYFGQYIEVQLHLGFVMQERLKWLLQKLHVILGISRSHSVYLLCAVKSVESLTSIPCANFKNMSCVYSL